MLEFSGEMSLNKAGFLLQENTKTIDAIQINKRNFFIQILYKEKYIMYNTKKWQRY